VTRRIECRHELGGSGRDIVCKAKLRQREAQGGRAEILVIVAALSSYLIAVCPICAHYREQCKTHCDVSRCISLQVRKFRSYDPIVPFDL
jgi:hypothetical protein